MTSLKPSAPSYAGIAGGVAGLVLLALSDWLFKGGQVPEAVQSAVLIIVPAAIAFISSHATRRFAAPSPANPAAPAAVVLKTVPQPPGWTEDTGNT